MECDDFRNYTGDLDTNRMVTFLRRKLNSFENEDFEEFDTNKDGILDKSKITVAICACDNELVWLQSTRIRDGSSQSRHSQLTWKTILTSSRWTR